MSDLKQVIANYLAAMDQVARTNQRFAELNATLGEAVEAVKTTEEALRGALGTIERQRLLRTRVDGKGRFLLVTESGSLIEVEPEGDE